MPAEGMSLNLLCVCVVQFRDLDVPTCVRLSELLTHLQEKGEEACREFYRALHLHVEEVYFSLPTRLRRRRGQRTTHTHAHTHSAVCSGILSDVLFLHSVQQNT